jgi:hypothetical protein
LAKPWCAEASRALTPDDLRRGARDYAGEVLALPAGTLLWPTVAITCRWPIRPGSS